MMRSRSLLTLAAALLAVAGLPAIGQAAGAQSASARVNAAPTSRVIVQEVRKDRVRVRALDGTVGWLRISAATPILLNDRPATLRDLRAGFVAELKRAKSGAVTSLKAYGEVPITTERGVVEAIDGASISLRKADGTLATFAIDQATQVLIKGAPGGLEDVRPAYLAAVQRRGNAPLVAITATPPPLVVDRGVVESATPTAITVRRASGTLTLAVDAATIVLVDGQPQSASVLRPGLRVAVSHRGSLPATHVRVFVKTAG